MTRVVTLIHRLGSVKTGLTGDLIRGGKVAVRWPLDGIMLFHALTGRESGSPQGPWRLSDEDVAAFAAELELKPIAPKLRPRKTLANRTRTKPDPRQLSLVEK